MLVEHLLSSASLSLRGSGDTDGLEVRARRLLSMLIELALGEGPKQWDLCTACRARIKHTARTQYGRTQIRSLIQWWWISYSFLWRKVENLAVIAEDAKRYAELPSETKAFMMAGVGYLLWNRLFNPLLWPRFNVEQNLSSLGSLYGALWRLLQTIERSMCASLWSCSWLSNQSAVIANRFLRAPSASCVCRELFTFNPLVEFS